MRGGTTELPEGDQEPDRVVVPEFVAREIAKAWWSSAEYAPAKALRQNASNTRMIAVEGV